jgi:hypothetical protein
MGVLRLWQVAEELEGWLQFTFMLTSRTICPEALEVVFLYHELQTYATMRGLGNTRILP